VIVTTSDSIPGSRIVDTKGLVRGNTVRAAHAGDDFLSVIKNVFGGELEEYTRLISQAREQAVDRMIEAARRAGGNAIIGVRFATVGIMSGAAEVLAYGTAVVAED